MELVHEAAATITFPTRRGSTASRSRLTIGSSSGTTTDEPSLCLSLGGASDAAQDQPAIHASQGQLAQPRILLLLPLASDEALAARPT